MPWILVALIIVVFLAHSVWIEEYFRRYRRNRGSLKGAGKLSTLKLQRPEVTREEYAERSEYFVALARRQQDVCLVGGTLGVTAWAALYVGSFDTEFRLSGISMALLLSGVITLVGGPMVARKLEAYVTEMIRESAVYVGFSAIIFSLCSMVIDLAGSVWSFLTLFLAVAITVTDVWQVVKDHITLLRRQLPPRSRCECCGQSLT